VRRGMAPRDSVLAAILVASLLAAPATSAAPAAGAEASWWQSPGALWTWFRGALDGWGRGGAHDESHLNLDPDGVGEPGEEPAPVEEDPTPPDPEEPPAPSGGGG